ncbi:MAG: D-alanyl-D-alanine carboxypeptidase family protein [Bacillota bacterium]|jgi:D-alanyl-D-alanine carboxypeptidase (penicillin-binding protein 5/6)|nr:D-alanyl-D-alanine carboxypeptidase [Bacillota bacterium]HOC06372.1 D-alanyl-D-alanine carboxypeptidase family protein [Bacillota bacterium]HPZ21787.1 D-alanyl-D-alanine carboxypeptidase family protein [Bacillota bacterium]HQD19167.1 D-alanyl-D-alanine carboxypeptidase family protein [Bacillota bacterium]
MKKYFCMLLTLLLLMAMIAPAGAAEQKTASLIMDFETGQILHAENIDTPLPPASITKLMTLHLVFEALAQGKISLDDPVRASANASNLPQGSSTIFLGTGEVLTVKELLEAVAIISANDAGIALAEHIAGSEGAFIAMMNEKARELDLENTTFTNVHGLHAEGHLMSARDIAILSRETLKKYPDILKYSSIKYLRMERDTRYVRQGYFDMHSTFASLIGWRNIDGLKTGWTPEANRCITVTAEENGRRYIVVVMGEETISQRDKKVKELLAKAFDRFHPVVAAKAGDVIDTIAIDMAKNTAAEIVPAQDVTLVISRTESVEEFETKIDILPGLKAPMKKGDLAGTLSYYRGEEKIAEVDLVLNADLEKASLLTRILRYISQLFAELADWLLGLFE